LCLGECSRGAGVSKRLLHAALTKSSRARPHRWGVKFADSVRRAMARSAERCRLASVAELLEQLLRLTAVLERLASGQQLVQDVARLARFARGG
jgi:hypothetical protein